MSILKPEDSVARIFAESDDLVKRRHYDDAERALERARGLFGEQDARVVGYDDRLARIDLFRGQTVKAKGLFMESLRMAQLSGIPSPEVADAYWGLAQCLERQNDGSHAIIAYKHALEVGVAPETSALIRERVKALEGDP